MDETARTNTWPTDFDRYETLTRAVSHHSRWHFGVDSAAAGATLPMDGTRSTGSQTSRVRPLRPWPFFFDWPMRVTEPGFRVGLARGERRRFVEVEVGFGAGAPRRGGLVQHKINNDTNTPYRYTVTAIVGMPDCSGNTSNTVTTDVAAHTIKLVDLEGATQVKTITVTKEPIPT